MGVARRVNADADTTHVAHESTRASCEVLERDGRVLVAKGGVLPKGQRFVPGLRAAGTLAYASIYEQGAMAQAGQTYDDAPFYLERRVMERIFHPTTGAALSDYLWVTDTSWGKPGRISPRTGRFHGLSLEKARSIASLSPDQRVMIRDGNGRYYPDHGNWKSAEAVPKESAPTLNAPPAVSVFVQRPRDTKGKKGKAGFWQ